MHHARLSQSIFMGLANFYTLPSVETHKWVRVAERREGDGGESKLLSKGWPEVGESGEIQSKYVCVRACTYARVCEESLMHANAQPVRQK